MKNKKQFKFNSENNRKREEPMAQTIDLRKLIMAINEQKNLNAQLALEFDCMIEVEDPKDLIKSFNYIINYCTELSEGAPIFISLNDQMDEYVLNFSVNTTKTEIPPLSPQLEEALKPYDAKLSQKSEPGKWVQTFVTFV